MGELFDGQMAEWGSIPTKEKKENPNLMNAGKNRRKTEMVEIPEQTMYRRAYGEVKLLELAGMTDLKQGHSYHFITGGGCGQPFILEVCNTSSAQIGLSAIVNLVYGSSRHPAIKRMDREWQHKESRLLCGRDIPRELCS